MSHTIKRRPATGSYLPAGIGAVLALLVLWPGTLTAQDSAAATQTEAAAEQESSEDDSTEVSFAASHKQSRMFKPEHEGQTIPLHTFCLDNEGRLLAGVGGHQTSYVYEDGEAKLVEQDGQALIQVYSHEQELLSEYPIDITPTAVNVDNSGNIFVGGDGKVLKLSPEGQVQIVADSPALADVDKLRETIRENLQQQYDEIVESTKSQVESLQKRIAKIEETAEEDRSRRQKIQLKSFQQTLEMMESQQEQMASFYKPTDERIDQSVAQSKEIRSIAINDNHVYVTCVTPGSFGYEIWRMSRDLTEPKQVLEDMSGCCGQLDIQAEGDSFYVAENTRFRVTRYDRDGKKVSEFGRNSNRGDDQSGFGSCCNPMNIRCCDNGEILTAESSIGHIKRFSADGELIGYVGKAKIGGGCKHVPLGHDVQHDIYYMMYQDEGAICVLEPAERVGETEDEKNAKEARNGLGKKIVGKWSLKVTADSDQQGDAGEGDDVEGDDVEGDEAEEESGAIVMGVDSLTDFVMLDFQADGTLEHKMGASEIQMGWEFKWVPVKQEDQTLTVDLVDGDGIQTMTVIAKFKDDDTIECAINYASIGGGTRTFVREK